MWICLFKKDYGQLELIFCINMCPTYTPPLRTPTFSKFKILKNWSVVDLQCFMCTTKWFSHVHTYVNHVCMFTYFLLSLLQDIEYNSLCYRVGPGWLSILNIVVCVCQSQIPNLSLLLFPFGNHKFVFYVCECFCFVNTFICIPFCWIPCINYIIWHSSFSVWLTSLSMTVYRSIHVATNGISSFFSGWVRLHCVYVAHPTYLSLCWWTVCCLHVLAAVSTGVWLWSAVVLPALAEGLSHLSAQ